MTTTFQDERSVNVVVTRTREGNEELAAKLRLAGMNPIPVEAVSIRPPDNWSKVDGLLKRLASFDWLIFTSASGVKQFGIRMQTLSLRLPWKGAPRVAAVGRQTAEAVSRLGVRSDFVPSSYTTGALAEELPAERGSKLLLLRANVAGGQLARRLRERGFEVEEEPIYRVIIGERPAPDVDKANLIVFASPSAVRGFCSILSKSELVKMKKLKTVCIGPVTESAARERGFRDTTKPESYTLEAVVRELVRLRHDGS